MAESKTLATSSLVLNLAMSQTRGDDQTSKDVFNLSTTAEMPPMALQRQHQTQNFGSTFLDDRVESGLFDFGAQRMKLYIK